MAAGSAREDCQQGLVDTHDAIATVCVDLLHACGCLQSDGAEAKELQLQGREVWRVQDAAPAPGQFDLPAAPLANTWQPAQQAQPLPTPGHWTPTLWPARLGGFVGPPGGFGSPDQSMG